MLVFPPKVHPGSEYFVSGVIIERKNGALNVVYFAILSSFEKLIHTGQI